MKHKRSFQTLRISSSASDARYIGHILSPDRGGVVRALPVVGGGRGDARYRVRSRPDLLLVRPGEGGGLRGAGIRKVGHGEVGITAGCSCKRADWESARGGCCRCTWSPSRKTPDKGAPKSAKGKVVERYELQLQLKKVFGRLENNLLFLGKS